MKTLLAWLEKNIAAWPAEFAPPTMNTSSPYARESFRLGGAVVDAASRETINARHIEFPVGDAGRDDQGVARDLRPITEGNDAVRVFNAHRADLLGGQDLHLEALRLVHGPPRQIATRKPGGETQIVLDAAARSGLSAWRLALYEDGLQAFGGSVDRGREAGWSSADDHQVVELLPGAGLKPDLLGYLPVLRRLRVRAVLVDD